MEAAIKNTRRKSIDIPEDVFQYLSIKATAQGMNLKRYIENLLAKDAENSIVGMSDNDTYKWLSAHEPDGLVCASKKEQGEFRKWLGL